MRKTVLCLVLLAVALAGPIFAADSIFKSQQTGSGLNFFLGGGYGVDVGAEMVLWKPVIADVLPIDIGAMAWADFSFWGTMDLGIGVGVSAHIGLNLPFAFVTGEELRMAYGLGFGLPIFNHSSSTNVLNGLGFAGAWDWILYTDILPANMGIRFGYTMVPYASGGGIGLNIKL